MNALELEEWRKVRRKKKCRVARPNDKLVVGVKVIYKKNTKDGEDEKYGCRLVAYYKAPFHPFEHPFIEYGTRMGLV